MPKSLPNTVNRTTQVEVQAPAEGSRAGEEALIAALKEFVAFTVDSYRDGMAAIAESPEEFIGLAMETWQDMREVKS